jgi:RNA polymerase sigma-54 factor
MNHLLENLYELANGNIKQLSKICGVDNSDIFKMLKDIRKCKSKPLSNYSEESITIAEPDIIVKKSLSKWTVELNENNLPRILVNTGYWEELARKKISKEDKKYLSDRYASGKWLLKALEQREATILRVSTEIIKQQNDFLERGLAYMRPMILKDIANELDLHESTISRITNSKEISTPRGVFQLKFFFSKNISKSDGGEDISSEVVKNKIKIFINKERDKILSDSKLALLLKESGINVARRTVTKYRVNMRIPSSFERKKIRKLVT